MAFSFGWFHCEKNFLGNYWFLYAGHTIIGRFPTKYKAYKKRCYLQSLLDHFKFEQVRNEICLLIEDMRDGT